MVSITRTRAVYTNKYQETAKLFKFEETDKSLGYNPEDKNYMR